MRHLVLRQTKCENNMFKVGCVKLKFRRIYFSLVALTRPTEVDTEITREDYSVADTYKSGMCIPSRRHQTTRPSSGNEGRHQTTRPYRGMKNTAYRELGSVVLNREEAG